MTVISDVETGGKTVAYTSEQAIIAALRRLPPTYLPEVLHFIEFLDFKIRLAREVISEDSALWEAVAANEEYKQLHPDETLEGFESGDAFLKAVADL